MMEVRPISDRSAIEEHMRGFPCLAHDDREPGYIDHPALHYWGGHVDGELAGVFMEIEASTWDREVHVAILKKFVRQGRELARLFIDAMFANPDVERLTAVVMADLSTARQFVRRVGFADEGTRRNGCRKGGKMIDLHLLGLLRSEWEAMS